jgi:hypothetical protein
MKSTCNMQNQIKYKLKITFLTSSQDQNVYSMYFEK